MTLNGSVAVRSCGCGCGQDVRPGRSFLRGHFSRTNGHKTQHDLPPDPKDEEKALIGAPALLCAIMEDAVRHKHTCLTGCWQCRLDREWAAMTAAWGVASFIVICETLTLPWEPLRAWFLSTAGAQSWRTAA